jgi:flavodoxin
MKALVVFDSCFGNTAEVAESIAEALGSEMDVELREAGDIDPARLQQRVLLIVGSPTRQFMPSGPVKDFLGRIPRGRLKGISAAAFDTRIDPDDVDSAFLRFMMKVFGYAAGSIARKLKKKGAELIVSPEGFIVDGEKGPLRKGELDRAARWAREKISASG